MLEAGAYVASDSLYARNAGHLYRNLRLEMFAGVLHPHRAAWRRPGLASRFISDAETLEQITLSILDRGAMQVVEFASALTMLAILEPWTVVVVLPSLACTWLTTARLQRPAAAAGQRRQEQLEAMTATISRELAAPISDGATARFRLAAEQLMSAEVRLGWLRALNLQGSGGLAKLGPITAVVAAALLGHHHAGTLMAIYLLAQRTFWGFDGLVDLRLDTQSVRGGVARCFELIGRRCAMVVSGLTKTPSGRCSSSIARAGWTGCLCSARRVRGSCWGMRNGDASRNWSSLALGRCG